MSNQRIKYITLILFMSFPFLVLGQGKITRNQSSQNKTTTFTKFSVSGAINGHDYVDLGLSSGTLWATNNIGANTPAGYGNYFAWAETKSKKVYSKENCTTYNTRMYFDGLPSNIKSDTIRAMLRIIDNPKYDAARANWGEGWQLPSSADFAELNKECIWQYMTIDGHNGYKITGPNGNLVFLPMAGYIEETYKSQVGTGGFYWTGDFCDDTRSIMFDFHKSSHDGIIWSNRQNGKSIRPVLRDRKPKNTIKWANEL